MPKYDVYLTYTSMRDTSRVTIEASDADDARSIALRQHPNATIRGPGSVVLASDTGNCLTHTGQ